MSRTHVIVMGAAGRDFHNFNTFFKGNEQYEVVAFTATQIPGIGGRQYPTELAGKLYPDGIPIHDEADLVSLIKTHDIDQVVFAYSDVAHEYVMHKASVVICISKFRIEPDCFVVVVQGFFPFGFIRPKTASIVVSNRKFWVETDCLV